ncbi:MAG: hypothetical protein Q9212_004354 [Teloschistes hypoglaucus]
MVPMSFGTETDSSIIGPAQINSVVGIKPTPGLTSRNGVVPISYTMDTVGLFGRTVADAVAGLNVIIGQDDRDALTCNSQCGKKLDYSQYIKSKELLKGAKFGLPRKRCWDLVDAGQKTIAFKLFDAMKEAADLGHREHGRPDQSEFTVVKVEAYNAINAYLSEISNTPIKTLEDVVNYNNSNKGTEGPAHGDTAAFPSGQILAKRGEKDQTYYDALEYTQNMTRTQGIDAALRPFGTDGQTIELDALLLCDRKGAGQMLAAQAGYPIISIPTGIDDAGLSVGLSVHQRAWKEPELIKWASAIEDLVHHVDGWRPTPDYKNSLSKNIPIETA